MPPVGDLTARARIRDAALRHFADRGAEATTVRAVAKEAGVTPGLICHHFGSKRGLREACDAYVLEYLRDGIWGAANKSTLPDLEFLAAEYRRAPVVPRYLARALIDGSAAAAALFDDLVTLTENNLTKRRPPHGTSHTDPRARATVHVAMLLGVWVFHDHMVRVLDADASALLERVTAALADTASLDFVGADSLGWSRRDIR
ncbi:transcriptional regulator (plasmid) [Mycolicibacterium chubuense NBB4]|uniref:Transcriptional regulator n=1 Tax=Mycolicibacterium chubuense (strain NBB4) TaxID=710421 RepID=I4BTQ5_MYCCN|nr:TetR/AcrR family transcriptional regulator [Mycolicibacterium chubuense]AFM20662.1 transcriptional regulator [Mycolicibacterium chubuense NBB4]